MKTIRTIFLVIAATVGLLASLTVSTSAVGLAAVVPTGNDQGAFSSTPGSPVIVGDTVTLKANFASSQYKKEVVFYKETAPDSGDYEQISTVVANSSGDATLKYVVPATVKLYAAVGTLETEIYTLTALTPNSNGTLAPMTGTGKTATATFNDKSPGAATKLQIQRIPTKETNEVNSTDPNDPTKQSAGPWVTIATSTQDQAGNTTFKLPSPYPYRVAHQYRAVSLATTTPAITFGLADTTPESTGLPAVYFSTNEGHAVDTRSRYFEGVFSMTADSVGLGCAAIPNMKFSTMKGRGNYSWTFKRKSFTLKLGDSTNVCGMGKSKKYALVSQDYDKSFLRNPLAQYIGSKFSNLAWTPKSKPVDFYLNGKYLGNYLLVERIAIQSSRVNIDELNGDDPAENVEPGVTGGYILEWDFRKGADYNAYLGSDSGYVGVKEPENDVKRDVKTNKGISSAQKTYIHDYLNDADNALRRGSCQSSDYEDYIDKASAVDYYIAMEYMKPIDGNMWASVYMYKPRNGKLFFGPLWDFDLSSGMANREGNAVSSSGFYLRNNLGTSAQQSSTTWFHCLNKRADFRAAVTARWNEVKDSLQPATFLDQQSDIIATSANRSYSKAPNGATHGYRIGSVQVIKSNWAGDVSYLRSWAVNRKSWLNGGSGFN